MTVYEFLRKRTFVHELCVIRDAGWIVMTVWIDPEDIFRTDPTTSQRIVKSDEAGTIRILNHNGEEV